MRHADRIYSDRKNAALLRIVIVAAAVTLAAFFTLPQVFAAPSGKTYAINRDTTMISAPNKSGTDVVALSKGDAVTFVESVSKTWVKVSTASGKEGYVRKAALTGARATNADANSNSARTAQNATGAGEIYVVRGKSATLKDQPKSSGKVIARYFSGAKLTLIERVSGSILYLGDENGLVGYANANAFTLFSDAPTASAPSVTPPPATAPVATAPAQTAPAQNAPAVTAPAQNVPAPQWAPLKTNVAMSVVSIDKQKYSYATMVADIEALSAKFPGQMTIRTIGASKQGKNIYAIRIGNPEASKSILVDGALHAREYMATLLIMRQIEYYLSNPNDTYKGDKIASILNRCSIWFVPMCNPDGVNLSQNGLSAATEAALKAELQKMNNGSTNFERWKANIDGVDLNNNFSAGWKQGKSAPASEGFGGNGPLTTSETKALSSFLLSQTNIAATLNYHSVGNVIYWHFGQTGATLARDKAIADELGKLTGYTLMPEYYNTASGGGFMDYVIAKSNLPSFTLELGPANVLAPQPISQFTNIWNVNKYAPIHLAWRKLT